MELTSREKAFLIYGVLIIIAVPILIISAAAIITPAPHKPAPVLQKTVSQKKVTAAGYQYDAGDPIEQILRKREGMFYPGEINLDSSMLSVTLLMRSSFVSKELFKEIAYSLIPELREVVGDKKIIRLWFQRNLPGGKVMLYGKATHPTALSKIKFKFYSY